MVINTNTINIDAAAGVLELEGNSVGATLDFATVPLDDVDYFILTGSGALSASVNFTNTTPTDRIRYTFLYKANVTIGVNNITFFGTSLSSTEATKNLIVEAVYEGAAWTVWVDASQKATQWIETGMIQDLAITTNKLDNLAVTTGKLNNNAVTHAKYQTIADQRILGNVSGGAAVPSELTPAQVNTLVGSVVQVGGAADSITTTAFNGAATGPGATNFGDAASSANDYSLAVGVSVQATGNYSVALGNNCTSSGDAAFSAGASNAVSGDYSASTGIDNTVLENNSFASGDNNVVAVGATNSHVSGSYSRCEGENSVSTGHYANATRYSQKSHSAGRHGAAVGSFSQETVLMARATTTDATVTNIFLDGIGNRITIPTDTIAFFEGTLVAAQQGGAAGTAGDSACWKFNGTISNVAGVTTLVDSVLWQDGTGAWGAVAQRSQVAAAATWVMTCTADNTNDALDITVTGQVNKNIYWHCVLKINEIKYA